MFQTATVLEDKVRERTRRLETALRELEKSNRELSIAKEQTETAQTRLMEAVESISEGFVHFDADDRLVLCNTKFLEFWSDGKRDIREVLRPGVSFREISRWTVETGLIVDVDGDPDEWLRGRLYRHSNPSDPHVVHLASGRWLQIRERQTRDGGTVGIYTDITAIKLDEQQRREQELAEKSILLQSTLDNLAQGVSVFDKHLRLVAWNERFVELLELPDWLVRPGASFQDYLRYRSARGDFGDDGETAIAIRMQHVREREPAKREQMLPNGTVLEMRRDPMPGGGFVTTYTDITDRQIAAVQLRKPRRAWNAALPSVPPSSPRSMSSFVRRFTSALKSEALRLAKGEADKANMSKTRFLAAASHDLLQPLNAARLFVTALSERPLREKEREFATHIDRALGSVESLLGTLLDISKLDAGAVSAEKADFVIGDLISVLADEYAPIAKEANLDLIALPCSRVVRSDPALLSRVLRNFLSNAIRYTRSGRVLLGCRRRGWRVRIEVWDTGQGIPDGCTDEIFEEFRQLNHHDRAHSKSFGLGLAIVKRISQLLDHPIGVRSKLGKGSVFFVDVPVGALPRALPKHGVCHAVPNDALSSAIAVMIDDQESILDGMRELFLGWDPPQLPPWTAERRIGAGAPRAPRHRHRRLSSRGRIDRACCRSTKSVPFRATFPD